MRTYRHRFEHGEGFAREIDVEANRPCDARDGAWNHLRAWLSGGTHPWNGWALKLQTAVDLIECLERTT